MGKIKRTIKEQEFIKAYIGCNGNAGKAYLQVFPHVKKESAYELGSRLLRKVEISITELLDKIGIDDHAITQKLNEGLTATRSIGKEGSKKKVPNYTINQKYLDMILKLKASYPVDKSKLELSGSIGQATTVILKEVIYCPLSEQCPIKNKVELALKAKREV